MEFDKISTHTMWELHNQNDFNPGHTRTSTTHTSLPELLQTRIIAAFLKGATQET